MGDLIPDATVRHLVPAVAEPVIAECVAEAWRTLENTSDATANDVAADIVCRLSDVYGVG